MQARYRATVRLLVVDVDHTLFDWLRAWASTYRSLLARVTAMTHVAPETVLDELGAVHRAAGSSEPPDPLGRLPSLVRWHDGVPARQAALTEAWRQAVACGDEALAAYPGVRAALQRVRAAGTPVIACSETAPDLVVRRLQRLGLLDGIDALAVNLATPTAAPIRLIDVCAEKPDPLVLHRICEAVGVLPHHATCVGDHLHKDVGMAQAAGAHDVWARYGTARALHDLGLLDRLRHWQGPSIDVDRFGPAPTPTWTLEASLLELLDLFDFAPPR